MKKQIWLLIFTIAFGTVSAQTTEEETSETQEEFQAWHVGYLGFNFLLGVPQGLFAERQGNTSWGCEGSLLIEVKRPLSLGVGVNWQKYDSDSDSFFEIDDEGFEYLVEEETSNQILTLTGMARVEPELNLFFRPYLDGYFGVNRFYTRTVFRDVELDENLNSRKDHANWALTYGGAAGVLINVWDNIVFLDLKCAYRIGNTAEYNTRIEGENNPIPLDNFELRRSPTTQILPQIGISMALISQDDEVIPVGEVY